jgi:homopolymeric O-antigen transport system permease protein
MGGMETMSKKNSNEMTAETHRPPPAAYLLPEKPIVTLEASESWVALNICDLWAYRELLYFLVWRDIKVRYRQTVLGAGWAILQPLVAMLVFTYFFGKLARIPSDGIPYPIFVYAGLLPWTFCSNAILNAGNSLVGSSNLITKVYFPRLIIPSAAVGSGLIDFAIAFGLLIGLLVFYDFVVTWNLLMLPALVLVTALLALGVGMWMAALNVRFRDMRYALPFLIQVWFFTTPIIYPSSMMPENQRWLIVLNPLTGIIEGYRASLFDQVFDWPALALSVAFTLALLVYAAYTFRRLERSFAEFI